jgi:UDP-N-acetylglucosamine diphosphorylase/glucosamine-1-phosphate N-acetyltransferase
MDNQPLLGHVLTTSSLLNPTQQVIIVGHFREKVINYIESSSFKNCVFAVQENQLGTGHAVMQSKEALQHFSGNVLILCGDVPLLSKKTLDRFIASHADNKSDVSVLSTFADEPFGYGRIIRDDDYFFIGIKEEKDASDEEKEICEINSGVYLVDKEMLFDALDKINSDNAQGEYYLTDIISILKSENRNVMAFPIADFEELQGVNTLEDLQRVELVYKSLKQ